MGCLIPESCPNGFGGLQISKPVRGFARPKQHMPDLSGGLSRGLSQACKVKPVRQLVRRFVRPFLLFGGLSRMLSGFLTIWPANDGLVQHGRPTGSKVQTGSRLQDRTEVQLDVHDALFRRPAESIGTNSSPSRMSGEAQVGNIFILCQNRGNRKTGRCSLGFLFQTNAKKDKQKDTRTFPGVEGRSPLAECCSSTPSISERRTAGGA